MATTTAPVDLDALADDFVGGTPPTPAPVRPSTRPGEPRAITHPLLDPTSPEFQSLARKYGHDPAEVGRMMGVESNFRARPPDSPKGAQGPMQLMDTVQKDYGVTDPYDVTQNVTAGLEYLRDLKARYKGNKRLAYAAYNAGPGVVDRLGRVPNYPETQNYVNKILGGEGIDLDAMANEFVGTSARPPTSPGAPPSTSAPSPGAPQAAPPAETPTSPAAPAPARPGVPAIPTPGADVVIQHEAPASLVPQPPTPIPRQPGVTIQRDQPESLIPSPPVVAGATPHPDAPIYDILYGARQGTAGVVHQLRNVAMLADKLGQAVERQRPGTIPWVNIPAKIQGALEQFERAVAVDPSILQDRNRFDQVLWQAVGEAVPQLAELAGLAYTGVGTIPALVTTNVLSAADKGVLSSLWAGIKGAALGKVQGLASRLPGIIRIPGMAALFGGEAYLETQDPRKAGAQAIIGGALAVPGGPRPSLREAYTRFSDWIDAELASRMGPPGGAPGGTPGGGPAWTKAQVLDEATNGFRAGRSMADVASGLAHMFGLTPDQARNAAQMAYDIYVASAKSGFGVGGGPGPTPPPGGGPGPTPPPGGGPGPTPPPGGGPGPTPPPGGGPGPTPVPTPTPGAPSGGGAAVTPPTASEAVRFAMNVFSLGYSVDQVATALERGPLKMDPLSARATAEQVWADRGLPSPSGTPPSPETPPSSTPPSPPDLLAKVREEVATRLPDRPAQEHDAIAQHLLQARQFGIVDTIEQWAAQGLTRNQIADRLRQDKRVGGFNRFDTRDLVQGVQDFLGIPPSEQRGAFQDWRKDYRDRKQRETMVQQGLETQLTPEQQALEDQMLGDTQQPAETEAHSPATSVPRTSAPQPRPQRPPPTPEGPGVPSATAPAAPGLTTEQRVLPYQQPPGVPPVQGAQPPPAGGFGERPTRPIPFPLAPAGGAIANMPPPASQTLGPPDVVPGEVPPSAEGVEQDPYIRGQRRRELGQLNDDVRLFFHDLNVGGIDPSGPRTLARAAQALRERLMDALRTYADSPDPEVQRMLPVYRDHVRRIDEAMERLSTLPAGRSRQEPPGYEDDPAWRQRMVERYPSLTNVGPAAQAPVQPPSPAPSVPATPQPVVPATTPPPVVAPTPPVPPTPEIPVPMPPTSTIPFQPLTPSTAADPREAFGRLATNAGIDPAEALATVQRLKQEGRTRADARTALQDMGMPLQDTYAAVDHAWNLPEGGEGGVTPPSVKPPEPPTPVPPVSDVPLSQPGAKGAKTTGAPYESKENANKALEWRKDVSPDTHEVRETAPGSDRWEIVPKGTAQTAAQRTPETAAPAGTEPADVASTTAPQEAETAATTPGPGPTAATPTAAPTTTPLPPRGADPALQTLFDRIRQGYKQHAPRMQDAVRSRNSAALRDVITRGVYNDVVSPDNAAGRKIFEDITGVKLPGTLQGTQALFTGQPFPIKPSAAPPTPPERTPQTEATPREAQQALLNSAETSIRDAETILRSKPTPPEAANMVAHLRDIEQRLRDQQPVDPNIAQVRSSYLAHIGALLPRLGAHVPQPAAPSAPTPTTPAAVTERQAEFIRRFQPFGPADLARLPKPTAREMGLTKNAEVWWPPTTLEGMTVWMNGHLMDTKAPPYAGLRGSLKSGEPVSPENVAKIIAPVRADAAYATTLTPLARYQEPAHGKTEARDWILFEGAGKLFGFDRKYIAYLHMQYPKGTFQGVKPEDPVGIYDQGKLAAILAPVRVRRLGEDYGYGLDLTPATVRQWIGAPPRPLEAQQEPAATPSSTLGEAGPLTREADQLASDVNHLLGLSRPSATYDSLKQAAGRVRDMHARLQGSDEAPDLRQAMLSSMEDLARRLEARLPAYPQSTEEDRQPILPRRPAGEAPAGPRQNELRHFRVGDKVDVRSFRGAARLPATVIAAPDPPLPLIVRWDTPRIGSSRGQLIKEETVSRANVFPREATEAPTPTPPAPTAGEQLAPLQQARKAVQDAIEAEHKAAEDLAKARAAVMRGKVATPTELKQLGAKARQAQTALEAATQARYAAENALTAVEEGRPVPTAPADAFARLTRMIERAISTGERVSSLKTIRDLQALADEAYGGTRAEGTYDTRDLYDAAEVALNNKVRQFAFDHDIPDPMAPLDKAQEQARFLHDLSNSLPTQTVRTAEQDALQQFSTPLDYAYAAAWVANLQPDDVVLEPSAGTGTLAGMARLAVGPNVYVNEIAPRRLMALEQQGYQNITKEDALFVNALLTTRLPARPTVVIMNPPFSATAQGTNNPMVGARHVEEALKLLAPGGRLMAIVGRGMKLYDPEASGGAREGTGALYRDWFAQVMKQYTLRAVIEVGGDVYGKQGTKFGTQLLVIDKGTPTTPGSILTGKVETIPELLDKLHEVRNVRTQQASTPEPERETAPQPSEGTLQPSIPAPGAVDVVDVTDQQGQPVSAPAGTPGRGPGGDVGVDVAGGGTVAPAPGTRQPGGRRPAGTGRPGRPESTAGGTAAPQPTPRSDDPTQPPHVPPAESPTGGIPEGLTLTDRLAQMGAAAFGDLFDEVAQETQAETPPPAPTAPPLEPTTQELADILTKGGRGARLPNVSPASAPVPPTQAPSPPRPGEGIVMTPEQEALLRDILGEGVEAESPPYERWLAGVDPAKYERMEPVLQAVLEQTIAAGGTERDFARGLLSRLGLAIKPYAMQFVTNLGQQKNQPDRPHQEDPRPPETPAGETADLPDLTANIFEPYVVQQIHEPAAQPHPGPLVQSAAMASVPAPLVTYQHHLPPEVISEGRLSLPQLETVIYAGQAHSQTLPSGARKGFMSGDGTGTGKSREIVGIFFDNWQQGRTKGLWISASPDLIGQARKEWEALSGRPGTDIFDLTKPQVKYGQEIKRQEGILFISYATLRGKEPKSDNPRTRLQQILPWLGADFDGVIIFDESHKMGNNTTGGDDQMHPEQASQQARAGQELRDGVPQARVGYFSATGATEVSNLGYLDRLGIWGQKTSFATKQDFINGIETGGVAAMELVARDMKAMGVYMARSLSFDGVTYERVEMPFDEAQIASYDRIAEAWQKVTENIEAALDATSGGADNHFQRMAAKNRFWAAQQFFFNQLITALKTPAMLAHIDTYINDPQGGAAVIQLTNTNAEAQRRRLAQLEEGERLEDVLLSPMQILMEYIEKSFPTAQQVERPTDDGGTIVETLLDSQGRPVQNQEAVALRDALLNDLAVLQSDIPDGPLEQILDHFGADNVAEVTGREQRLVYRENAQGQMERVQEARTKKHRLQDVKAFMDDKKRVLVFSAAGDTGMDYHASREVANQRQRHHYVLQPGWQAAATIQGLGRTHRTNQASAPIDYLMSTDLPAERRFMSSIARRLDQLGALGRGQRQASSQGLFNERDNLENSYARDALERYMVDINHGRDTQIPLDDFMRISGLNPERDVSIQRFLNRLFMFPVAQQRIVFEEFSRRLDDVIETAIQNGTFEVGMETIRADHITKMREQVIASDPATGADTSYVELKLQNKPTPTTWDGLTWRTQNLRGEVLKGYGVNKVSGKVYAFLDALPTLDKKTGNLIPMVRRIGVMSETKLLASEVQGKYDEASPEDAERLWARDIAALPEYVEHTEHLITGVLLPHWDKLSEGMNRVYRVQTDAGERLIGRVIPPSQLRGTLQNFGVSLVGGEEEATPVYTPAEAFARVLDHGATLRISNGWTLEPSRIGGIPRVELKHIQSAQWPELSADGVLMERIGYTPHYFLPTGYLGIEVYQRIMQNKLIAEEIAPRQGTVEAEPAPYGTDEQPRAAGVAAPEPAYATPFFSAVRKAIAAKMPGRAAPAQVQALLQKTPGIKADELKWLGIGPWLEEQQGPVTKQQVLDFLDANQVQVRTEVLGGPQPIAWTEGRSTVGGRYWTSRIATTDRPLAESIQLLSNGMFLLRMGGGMQRAYNTLAEAQSAGEQAIQNSRESATLTQYSSYTTPGADPGSYREVLFTLPPGSPGAPAQPFQSSHFRQPNIVAHLRMNTRTDAEGRRVLFVEEDQSDWQREGRKEGFGPPQVAARDLRVQRMMGGDGLAYEITLPDGTYVDTVPATVAATPDAARQLVADMIQRGDMPMDFIPAAPFVTTGDWYQLPLKWALRHAAEQGLDGVAWTTGRMQQERYDLRKVVEQLTYDPASQELVALDKHDDVVFEQQGVPPERIGDYVGADNAAALLAKPLLQSFGGGPGIRTLRGLDFAAGGEWATNLYDRMIPQFLNKYGKQWGARVGETTLEPSGGRYGVFDADGNRYSHVPYATRAAANAAMREFEGAYPEQSFTVLDIGGEAPTVHFLPITNAMRESVLTQGQPLYEEGTPYAQRPEATAADRRQAARSLADLERASRLPVRSTSGDVERVSGPGPGPGASGLPGIPGPAGSRLLGKALASEAYIASLYQTGTASFVGQLAPTPHDIAVLGQGVRDPQIERLFWIFMKGKEAVDVVVVSSRLPGSSEIFPNGDLPGLSRDDHIRLLQKQMRQSGATHYYQVHNHPAGDPTPSTADKNSVRGIARDMPGFLGHVVINSGKYAVIDAQGNVAMHDLDTTTLWASTGGRDPFLEAAPAEVPHPLNTKMIASVDDVARLAQQVNIPDGYVLAFYRSSTGQIRGIELLPVSLFQGRTAALRLGPHLKRRQQSLGAVETLTYYDGPDPDVATTAHDLYETGLLRDHYSQGSLAHQEPKGYGRYRPPSTALGYRTAAPPAPLQRKAG